MTSKARKLRKHTTDAEKMLWRYLRNRQILHTKFRRQHPIPPYIVDFICLEQKLVIEIDGSQHMQQTKQDQNRTDFLEIKGFRVIRFWNSEVLQETNAVLEIIYREITLPPHPAPLPGGERG